METEKYNTNSLSVSAILGLIKSGDIAIPEIQRPFVWKKKQVRDLLDSLYKGYPTGYLIIWKNPNVKLKDGSVSAGKKILIDGQQRVTALMTSIAGISVIDGNYHKDRIKIAFDPFQALPNKDDREAEIFAVQDQSHLKSKRWIPDVYEIFKDDFNLFSFVKKYCELNPEMVDNELANIITNLRAIGNRSIGVIELSEYLDIEMVTDIFIRINSKGTSLSQGDFVMSKIAADEAHGGNTLRKAIDYFAHLSVNPNFYEEIANKDLEFSATEYMSKIKWLKDETEDVYDPDYDDVIRVAFMHKFSRAKLNELVSLLSGRDFATREYRDEIIADTYEKLKAGVMNVFSEYNFKQFMVTIRGAGFISKKLVNSQMALDFAYTLYLILAYSKEVSSGEVKRLVQKWYVFSILTGRYSASTESAFSRDLRLIKENGIAKALADMEAAAFSDTFWNVAVVQDLMETSTKNPTYLVYLASQVMMNDISLLSNNITVRELIEAGDVHHIFPKAYLKAKGFSKTKYNQDANYAFLDTQINKSIGDKAPNVYFAEAKAQCNSGKITVGSISDIGKLYENLATNCVPPDVFNMDFDSYEVFLEKRRMMMAQKIRKYYESL